MSTTQTEVMKMALEALELNNREWKATANSGDSGYWLAEEQAFYQQTEKAIITIKEALANRIEDNLTMVAQPEQEPVAWADHGVVNWIVDKQFKYAALLYEAPNRTWVGLDDDEMLMIYGQQHEGKKYSLGRMVEAKLKKKNA